MQFLHHVCRLFADNTVDMPTKAERVQLFWQGFTATVLRSVSRQLRLTTYTGPQGPQLPFVPAIDDLGNALPRTWGDGPVVRPGNKGVRTGARPWYR